MALSCIIIGIVVDNSARCIPKPPTSEPLGLAWMLGRGSTIKPQQYHPTKLLAREPASLSSRFWRGWWGGNNQRGLKDMGREIRKVPPGWEHPRKEDGNYQEMYDQDYETIAKEYETEFLSWCKGLHETQIKEQTLEPYGYKYFWDYSSPPNEEYYRPKFTEEATHIQIYQNVGEGSPVSPVFADKPEMIEWLVENGYSREAAEGFAKSEWAMSGMYSEESGYVKDIEACAYFKKDHPEPEAE